MPAYRTLLEETLEAWQYTREGVIAELQTVGEDLGFRPGPESRSLAEIGRHILESGLMMVGEITRPDGDFQRASYPDFIADTPVTSQPS